MWFITWICGMLWTSGLKRTLKFSLVNFWDSNSSCAYMGIVKYTQHSYLFACVCSSVVNRGIAMPNLSEPRVCVGGPGGPQSVLPRQGIHSYWIFHNFPIPYISIIITRTFQFCLNRKTSEYISLPTFFATFVCIYSMFCWKHFFILTRLDSFSRFPKLFC